MSTLHDRLAALADDAPVGGPLPDLWQRGRRIARVRRLGTAAVAGVACLALLVVAALGWEPGRPVSVAPAGAQRTPAMPDRLYEPSGWLGSFEGAPGPLAAVFPRSRKHLFGSEPGIVGVSATTGRYGFLDVPDLADGTDWVALSPDGRLVGYATTGATGADANTANGDPVTGFAVLDAVSGHLERIPIPTAHGLSELKLSWIDDDTMLVDFDQQAGGDSADAMTRASSWTMSMMTWNVTDGLQPFAPADAAWSNSQQVTPGGHGWLMRADNGRWRWSMKNLDTDRQIEMRQPNAAFFPPGPAISPDGERLAFVVSGLPSPVWIVDRTGAVESKPVGDAYAAVYWLDETHVIGTRADFSREHTSLARLDLDTGRWTTLVAGNVVGGNIDLSVYAYELLANPTRHADGPPHPLSQRVALGLTVGILLVSGLALLGWRRRVRP